MVFKNLENSWTYVNNKWTRGISELLVSPENGLIVPQEMATENKSN